jgi:4'-phosphopantetheinyl transferase
MVPRPAHEPGTITCWIVDLQQPAERVTALTEVLAVDERQRAARFVFARDRRRFVVTRACLRDLLGRACDRPTAAIRFEYGVHGKPSLAPDLGGPTLHFSVSHSGDLALIVLAPDRPLGVDLEAVRSLPDLHDIAARYFTAAEASAIIGMPAQEERELAFFLCWTRKEAFVKALGDGLTLPLDRVRVSCRPGEPARILDIDGSPAAAEWSIYDLRPAPGFVGAAVMRGAPRPLSLVRFDFDRGVDAPPSCRTGDRPRPDDRPPPAR